MSPDPHQHDWLSSVVPLLGVHVYVAELFADDTYRLPFVGPNVDLMLGGVPEGGLTDTTWDAHIHPDDRAEYDLMFSYEAASRGEPVQAEYRVVGVDGVTRWVLERCVPRLPLSDGVVVLDGVVIDVSERQALVDELADARDTIERIAQSIDEVFYTYELLDPGGWRWRFTTPGLARLRGLDQAVDDVAGGVAVEAWDAGVHPDDREIYDAVVAGAERGDASDVEFRMIGVDGQTRWLHARDRPRGVGRPGLVDGVIADVTDRKLAEIALEGARADAEQRSRTDALTGLYNRRHFSDALAAEIARAIRDTTTPALLLIDLDYFKLVNDVHGHGAGDDVLIEAGARIGAALRRYDLLARFGGEEFVVLAPSVPDESALLEIGEHLRSAIGGRPFATRVGDVAVTASIGAVRATPDLQDTDELLDAADLAMYAAKKRGRDGVCLFADLRPATSPSTPATAAFPE